MVSEVPLSLTMADTESVTIWSLKHELASSPRLGLHGFHQAGAGAEALEDPVDVGDVDEDPPRLGVAGQPRGAGTQRDPCPGMPTTRR